MGISGYVFLSCDGCGAEWEGEVTGITIGLPPGWEVQDDEDVSNWLTCEVCSAPILSREAYQRWAERVGYLTPAASQPEEDEDAVMGVGDE